MLYWIVRWGTYLYARLFFRLTITFDDATIGVWEEGNAPVIIAPNHASYLDPPLISAAWPRWLTFFAGTHLFESSFWLAWLLRHLRTYPVNRDHGVAALKEAIRVIFQEKKSVVIFPEGTRSHDGTLQTMRDGIAFIAMKSGAKIIPTYMSGTYEAWPRGQRFPKLFGSISIHFGAPIDPSTHMSVAAITKSLTTAMGKLEDHYGR